MTQTTERSVATTAPIAGLPPGGVAAEEAEPADALSEEGRPDQTVDARRTRGDRAGLVVSGGILSLLGLVLLALLVQLGPLGAVRHHRDQETAYAELREQLANATAPVAPVDQDGRLYPLGTPVALLSIPVIGLHEVVLEGTSSSVLVAGPGHRRDTVLPGQAGISVILGRQASYGGPFSRIEELQPGTTFTVTTGQGDHTYKVLGVRHAGDPQPAPPTATQGRLTLVTATGTDYLPSGVVRVDAVLVSGVQDTPARVIATGSLPAAELPMHGDRGAWLLIVLWAEALLVVAVAFVWARHRWGRWQAWVVGVPLLAFVGLSLAMQVTRLLPNLT